MGENEDKGITRRKLLKGLGKLAYVAPTLTVLSLHADNTDGLSPPCGPNEVPPDCTPAAEPGSPEQNSRTESRTRSRTRSRTKRKTKDREK